MVNDALRQNYPESKELFRVLLTGDNLPDSLMTTISENGETLTNKKYSNSCI